MYIKTSLHETARVYKWSSEESLFPYTKGAPGRLLKAIKTSEITLIDIPSKGTQLKLWLLLEGKQKLFFKPKRYNLTDVIIGTINAGFDRHNSEVFAYFLAMVLNLRWIAPSTIRKIHVEKDILTLATVEMRKVMVKNESGSFCIVTECYYCPMNIVCPDRNGEIEGAAILYLDKPFEIHLSPWVRSAIPTMKMYWQKDNNYCKIMSKIMDLKFILNIVDIAIFDFLIQNGDRHSYETYKDKILLLDNGKGLGNPEVDDLEILAPLYQCCMLYASTWHQLEMLSGGSLTETIKLLSYLQAEELATEEHFRAVERRLLIVYATVQYCVGKHGSANVFKNKII